MTIVHRTPATIDRLSLVLAGLLGLASVVGILGGQDFYARYPVALAGLVGQDVYTLVVVVPVVLLALWLVRRGSRAGQLLWIGALFYVAYTYSFLVVGGFNALFPAYIAVVAIGLFGTIALLRAIDADEVAARLDDRSHLPRLAGAVCIGFAALFLLMWGGLTASAIATGEAPDPVRHIVVAIDSTVMLPLLFVGGLHLWRRRPLGYLLGGLLLTKLTLTGFGLSFTTLLAWAWAGSLGPMDAFLLALFGLMGASGLALLVPYLRALHEPVPGPAATGRPARPAPNQTQRTEPAIAGRKWS